MKTTLNLFFPCRIRICVELVCFANVFYFLYPRVTQLKYRLILFQDMTQNEFEILLQKLLILVRNNDQNNIDKNLNEDRDKIKLDDDDFVQNVMKVMQQETNEELLHGQNVTEKRDKRKKETIKKKKKYDYYRCLLSNHICYTRLFSYFAINYLKLDYTAITKNINHF